MEEIFMEWLDQIYWKGYAETLLEEAPGAYQGQLTEFNTIYKISQNEIPDNLSDGKGCNTVRTSEHSRYGTRSGNQQQDNATGHATS